MILFRSKLQLALLFFTTHQSLLHRLSRNVDLLYVFIFVFRQESMTMAKKLYVGNLAYSTTQEAVRELFAQAGDVADVALITDRDTGRPKGFGFVEMATEEGAQEAIRRFNGFTLDSRAL